MRFDLQGTQDEKLRLAKALVRCNYPFDSVAKNAVIPVSFRDLTADGALGLFWLSGRIEVTLGMDDQLLAEVLISEVAHAVDQYVLTDADRIKLQTMWHPSGPDEHTWFDKGPYETWEGEAMMGLFVAAYSDISVSLNQFAHQPTPAMVELLRSMGPVTPSPPPVVPPVQYVGCKMSKVFHRIGAHWFSCTAYKWLYRADAVADGRTPCKRCKP